MRLSATGPSNRWGIASASVTGAYHLRLGRGGDDAHAWAHAPFERVYFAVADGVGSASHGAVGSSLAARIAVDYLILAPEMRAQTDPAETAEVIVRAFHEVARGIGHQAGRLGLQSTDLGTTLICGVLTPEWLAAAQIGDGALMAELATGEAVTVLAPQDTGEYGAVYSAGEIRSDELLRQRLTSATQANVTALLATTDGLTHVGLREGAPFAPFFVPLVNGVRGSTDLAATDASLAQFLTSERVSKSAIDDLTLLIVADQTVAVRPFTPEPRPSTASAQGQMTGEPEVENVPAETPGRQDGGPMAGSDPDEEPGHPEAAPERDFGAPPKPGDRVREFARSVAGQFSSLIRKNNSGDADRSIASPDMENPDVGRSQR